MNRQQQAELGPGGDSTAAPPDDADENENKLRIAIDRIRRFCIYVSVRVRSIAARYCCRRSRDKRMVPNKMTSLTPQPDRTTQAGIFPGISSSTAVAIGRPVVCATPSDDEVKTSQQLFIVIYFVNQPLIKGHTSHSDCNFDENTELCSGEEKKLWYSYRTQKTKKQSIKQNKLEPCYR